VLESREQTYAMKKDASGSSNVALDGSYDRRVFCHILVIAIQAGFYPSVGEQAALRDSIIHHNETRARLREQQRLSHCSYSDVGPPRIHRDPIAAAAHLLTRKHRERARRRGATT